MQPFERLSSALQYQIVNALGFRSLRPVQELTIDAVLDGQNCVVLAPTAGGKTEAAFFPLLSLIESEDWRPISVIYVAPIRALLNNQEERLVRYCQLIGRRAAKWHGDTTQSERKAIIQEPPDILLTTPESLEAMMMSTRTPAARLFAGLRAVVIDEAHAFAASDRGAHLSAVLERLSAFCPNDVQRLGLSATVGNPETVLSWMQGSSKRNGCVVSPPRPPRAADVTIDFVGTIPNAAAVIEQLHRGEKRLVFVDSRRGVEELGSELRAKGVDTYLVHGSLAQGERQASERAFADGTNRVIVATSALELGIDIGDLDRVLQLDAPTTVASFLQRMGRTGRRDGAVANCTFLVTEEKRLLQVVALVELYLSGYIEPIEPSRRAFHVLAHQVLGMAMADHGLERQGWFERVRRASCFSNVTEAAADALVTHMVEHAILAETDGRLLLGPHGDKLYGRRNYAELYSVFSTPRVMAVQWAMQEIGSITTEFLLALDGKDGPPAFTLAGRAWRADHIDWDKGLCVVSPAENARAPSWGGSPQFLSYEMCQSMRRVLLAADEPPHWSQRVRERMVGIRAQHAFLRDLPDGIVDGTNEIVWWNFAGGRANLMLARMIEAELGGKCVARNVSISLRDGAEKSGVAFRQCLQQFRDQARPTVADVERVAAGLNGRFRLSKFEPCLPPSALVSIIEDSVLAVASVRDCLRTATPEHD